MKATLETTAKMRADVHAAIKTARAKLHDICNVDKCGLRARLAHREKALKEVKNAEERIDDLQREIKELEDEIERLESSIEAFECASEGGEFDEEELAKVEAHVELLEAHHEADAPMWRAALELERAKTVADEVAVFS